MIRNARLSDVPQIRELINCYAERERMLFRSLADLYESLRDFKVCEINAKVVGCCALQVIWSDLAEIKSLAVDPNYQGQGIGRELVLSLLDEARELGLAKVFALTLEEKFFDKLNFHITKRENLPMKVWSDCIACSKQDHCDEVAVMAELTDK